MSEPPSPPDRRPARRDLAVGLALLLAAVAGTVWLARRPAVPPSRPAAGTTWLDETVEVGAAGVVRRLRVADPTTVEIAVVPGPGAVVHVSFGPPRPPGGGADEPEPATARAWDVRAGDAPRAEPVFAPGLYVVRVEPGPGAPAGPVRLRVRSVAAPTRARGTGP